MTQEKIMCSFFNFSAPTYYKRKREGNFAIKMVEKYFTKEDLEDFLEVGSIKALDEFKKFQEIKDSKEYKEFLLFQEFKEYMNKKVQK